MKEGRERREEERKFKRIPVRFGLENPEHRAVAVQISTRGLFLSTNHPVYAPGSRLMIEITTPHGPYIVPAIVRHAKKVPPQLIRQFHAGMGMEFITVPQEVRDYLASL